MPTTSSGDGLEWESAEADTRLFAAYSEAVSGLRQYAQIQARMTARRYGDHEMASAQVDEVVQESVSRFLGLGEKLLEVQNPRAYVAAVVRRLFSLAMRSHVMPVDAMADARASGCSLLEDRDLLLDVAAVVEGWLERHGARGRDLLIGLRLESVGIERDLAAAIPILAKGAGLGERAARDALAQLVKDLSIRIGDPSRPARWHLQRQDRGYLRALAALVRALVVRGGRADLFDLRHGGRMAAREGVRVVFRDGGATDHEGRLANVSDAGLAFATANNGSESNELANLNGNGRSGVFELIPPPGAGETTRTLRGRVVAIHPHSGGLRCHVHLEEPIDAGWLDCLGDGRTEEHA